MADEPTTPSDSPPPTTPPDAVSDAATQSAIDEAAEAAEAEEFARLAKPRRRSPLIGLAVIAVGAVLLAKIAGDVRYALGPKTPVPLGEARALGLDSGKELPVGEGSFVEVRGAPDYRSALLFEPRGDSFRRAFYRMLGTRSRLWVRAEQTQTRHGLTDRIVGRLSRFDSLPYADQVRQYYATQVKTTLLVDLPRFRAAVEERTKNPGAAAAAAPGDPVGSLADDQLDDRIATGAQIAAGEVVVVDFPEDVLVTMPREKFAVEEDARHEAERLGAPLGPVVESRAGFTYPVRVPAAERNAFLARLEEKDLDFRGRRERFAVSQAGFRSDGQTLAIPSAAGQPPIYEAQGSKLVPRPPTTDAFGSHVDVPWAQVSQVQVVASVGVPPGSAWVVIEGEQPSDVRWAPLLAAGLVLFLLFNAWLLIRALRTS